MPQSFFWQVAVALAASYFGVCKGPAAFGRSDIYEGKYQRAECPKVLAVPRRHQTAATKRIRHRTPRNRSKEGFPEPLATRSSERDAHSYCAGGNEILPKRQSHDRVYEDSLVVDTARG
ncbi:uncharacterized protein SPSK_10052 [Sporothrix schenckii 1099-18]|uniref:Secreted protein n=1 Tax=Sporothrix schenckii 1099-18 TaxID=1397361 RepID=A0A0F2M5L2_SPOSC|nr:uncharacterized protein SPSK_10052 [Sporothrix schenckii 1099-18]KJR84399.1 hypothetical protein SPSK_10052 [Sporothrix schenckii 1099-18]